MRILQVECESAEWLSARELRFSLFFEKAGLPRSVMDDHLERSALHFVSTEHGCVTGCVRLFTEDGLTWSISQMAVDPSSQGKGTGRALLQAATDHASKAGATRIVLNARRQSASTKDPVSRQRETPFFRKRPACLTS